MKWHLDPCYAFIEISSNQTLEGHTDLVFHQLVENLLSLGHHVPTQTDLAIQTDDSVK